MALPTEVEINNEVYVWDGENVDIYVDGEYLSTNIEVDEDAWLDCYVNDPERTSLD